MHDKGIKAAIELGLVNPFLLELQEMKNVEVGLKLEEQLFCRVILDKVSLKKGYQKLALNADIIFDNLLISNPNVKQSISGLIQKILAGKPTDLKIAIAGPISLNGGGFLSDATRDLVLHLPLEPLVKEFLKSLKAKVEKFNLKSLMDQVNLAVNVNSSIIDIPAKIAVPAFIAIPKSLKIP